MKTKFIKKKKKNPQRERMEGKEGERSGGDCLRFAAKLKNVIRIGLLGFGDN